MTLQLWSITCQSAHQKHPSGFDRVHSLVGLKQLEYMFMQRMAHRDRFRIKDVREFAQALFPDKKYTSDVQNRIVRQLCEKQPDSSAFKFKDLDWRRYFGDSQAGVQDPGPAEPK